MMVTPETSPGSPERVALDDVVATLTAAQALDVLRYIEARRTGLATQAIDYRGTDRTWT